MKTVKCKACNAVIHEADICYRCGGDYGYIETASLPAEKNTAKEYAKALEALKNWRFDEAIKHCDKLLEAEPDFSIAFWIRLLAKNSCTVDAELIKKGFDPNSDPDFCNAVRYGSETEKAVYNDVKTMTCTLKHSLRKAVEDEVCRKKADSGIEETRRTMVSMVNIYQGRIFNTWSDLAVLEKELFALQTRGVLVSEEYRRALEETQKKADEIKKETAKKEKLTEDERDKYHIILDNIISRSTGARKGFEALLSGNSMIREFNEMHENRNALAMRLSEELEKLRSYEKEIKKKIKSIEAMEEKYRTVWEEIGNYNFSSARKVMGKKAIEEIYISIGFYG